MNRLTSGNLIVDQLAKIQITGDIIPRIWHKTILNEKGRTDRYAIDILAEIVYWYRPSEIRDEITGDVIAVKKKFKAAYLQKSKEQLADSFGVSVKTIQRSLATLKRLGVIKCHDLPLKTDMGIIPHCNYIELCIEGLIRVTYPEDSLTEAEKDKNVQALGQRCLVNETKRSKHLDNNVPNTDNKTNNKHNNISIYQKTKNKIMENIEYDVLIERYSKQEKEILSEIVNIITDTLLSKAETITICKNAYPIEYAKERFLQINSAHVQHIIENHESLCVDKNVYGYIRSMLFNVVTTLNSEITTEFNAKKQGGALL